MKRGAAITANIKKKVNWNLTLVEQQKRLIKSELDSRFSDDHKARQAYCLDQIGKIKEDWDPVSQLKLFIYIMTALVCQAKTKQLNEYKAGNLFKMAIAILKVQNISEEYSNLVQLYSDLYMAQAQVMRKFGDHWMSFWQHLVGERTGGANNSYEDPFFAFIRANRSLRLGYTDYAFLEFCKAGQSCKGKGDYFRSQLGKIQCLKYLGQISEVQKIINECKDSAKDEIFADDFAWEEAVLVTITTGCIDHIVEMTKPKNAHFQASYVMESSLWAKAHRSSVAMSKQRSVESLGKIKGLDLKRLKNFYNSARVLDDCYDFQIPLSTRINQLGVALSERNRLVTVDKELLLLASATRFLVRSKAYSLATFVVNEYWALSLKLSAGKSRDVFGLLVDIESRDWFPLSRESDLSVVAVAK